MAVMRILRDAGLIIIGGTLVALLANALSPRGLSLSRDYFGDGPVRERLAATSTAGTAKQTDSTDTSHTRRGFPRANDEQVGAWFHDPRRESQQIVFVDARSADAYAKGHIPGAYSFDHYHPENELATVVALAMVAEQVVVYCTGGDCEDSELAASDLIAAGVPAEKIVIYGGGITEWTKLQRPVVTGAAPGR